MRVLKSLILTTLIVHTASAEPLRYAIKPQQTVAYTVKIEVDRSASIETMSGVIVYTGKQSEESGIVVEYNGGLSKTTKMKASARPSRFGRGGFGGPPRFAGPPRPRSPWDDVPFRGLTQTRNILTIAPNGDVISMTGDSQLPYVLGNLSFFPFETLPDGDQREWTTRGGFSITTTTERDRFAPRLPFEDNNDEKVQTGGGELSQYRIVSTDGDKVTIQEKYSMTTPAANKEDTAFEMSGIGTWIFNPSLGLSESFEQKLTLETEDGNVTVKTPINISWNRLTNEEYEAHKTEVKEQREALMAKAREREEARKREAAKPKEPLPPTAIKSHLKPGILFQLKSPVWQSTKRELEKLSSSRMTGMAAADMDVLTRIGQLRAHKQKEVRDLAEKIWGKWKHSFAKYATEDQREAVAKAVGEEPEKDTMELGNPFVVEDDDDGKGVRTWTDSTGRFKIDGEFDKLDGSVVVLKNEAGKSVRVPKARLSEKDQRIVEKLTKE